MNKRQKEVLQYLDNREKRVLKELEEQYRGALEDINMSIQVMLTDEQTPSKVYRIQHQKALKSQIEGIIEKLHGKEYETIAEYLRDSYTDSFVGCMYDHAGQGIPLILPIDQNAAAKAIEIDSELSEDLYTSLGVDTQKLKKTIRQEITRGLATTMAFADIARNVESVAKAPLNRAKVIVKTEAHRIQEAARYDGMLLAKSKGAQEVKIWTSLGNSRVRDTHRELHGQIREVDKPFTYGTKKAMFPGDFGDPALDINCNCKGLTKATWLLDEITLKELEDQAAYWGLDKTKDFADYKKKYLKAAEQEEIKSRRKAAETLEKSGKSGIIKLPDNPYYDGLTKEQIAARYVRLDGTNLLDASFTDLPIALQREAVRGYDDAIGMYGNIMPKKIKAGKLSDRIYALYSSTYQTITLNPVANAVPGEAYASIIHEMTHHAENILFRSDDVLKAALKKLGLRSNSKRAEALQMITVSSVKEKDWKNADEIVAYAVERQMTGRKNELTEALFTVMMEKGIIK